MPFFGRHQLSFDYGGNRLETNAPSISPGPIHPALSSETTIPRINDFVIIKLTKTMLSIIYSPVKFSYQARIFSPYSKTTIAAVDKKTPNGSLSESFFLFRANKAIPAKAPIK